MIYEVVTAADVNPLLAREHYLGPMKSGRLIVAGIEAGQVVSAQVWRHPTSRSLPKDGSWLELSRWCLTPAAGENAGSRQHRASVKLIREHLPDVTTLVSYSDPGHGHGGALYRACNWQWRPTWHRLRPPPSGNGSWGGKGVYGVKDRWVFPVRRDPSREAVTFIDDPGAIRKWEATAPDSEKRWARGHPQLGKAIIEAVR